MKLLALLFLSDLALSYPSTITKGYQLCGSCHVTASGGTALTDYGRSLASDTMTTWSFENEVREFVRADSKYVDYTARYRHLAFFTGPSFPMYASLDLALKPTRSFTIYYGVGVYGRDMQPETRNWFLLFTPNQNLSARLGYFMPVAGLKTNDHSLPSKQFLGQNRGSERYGLELWLHSKRLYQIFLTYNYRNLDLESNSTNTLTALSDPEIFLSASYLGIKKFEPGIVLTGSEKINVQGIFARYSYGISYLFLEAYSSDTAYITYFRSGLNANGFDFFVTASHNDFFTDYALGLDWLARPGIEFSILASQKAPYVQLNLWR